MLLQWQTTGEQNTKDFIIQHSIDGLRWQSIGSTPAKGDRSGVTTYNFKHATPKEGINFYRILQQDNDGQYSFSKINTLRYASFKLTNIILPNPVKGSTMSIYSDHPIDVNIWDINGKNMWKGKLTAGKNSIDISSWTNGTYFLQSKYHTIKAIVLK